MDENEVIEEKERVIIPLFLQTVRNSTVHLLDKIFAEEKHWPLRIVYILLYLLSFSFCTVQIVNTFITFLSYGVVTKSQRFFTDSTE